MELPAPIDMIAKIGLETADLTLDGLAAAFDRVADGFNALREGLVALDARVEALESDIK